MTFIDPESLKSRLTDLYMTDRLNFITCDEDYEQMMDVIEGTPRTSFNVEVEPWELEDMILETMYSKALQHIEKKDVPDISSYMIGVIETSLAIGDASMAHLVIETEGEEK